MLYKDYTFTVCIDDLTNKDLKKFKELIEEINTIGTGQWDMRTYKQLHGVFTDILDEADLSTLS